MRWPFGNADDEVGVRVEARSRVADLDAIRVRTSRARQSRSSKVPSLVDAKLRARARTQLGIDDAIGRVEDAQRLRAADVAGRDVELTRRRDRRASRRR